MYLRLMRKEDIPQVAGIDREAFPSLWPPINYQRELDNSLAHYIVAVDETEGIEGPEGKAVPQRGFSGLVSRLGRFFGNRPSPAAGQYIFGFAGLWLMAGEAHIMNIAVREKHRRQGIGEALFISLIDLAVEADASLITLEVRASNTAAQSLYAKYGLVQVGVRRGYYTDNREDGILMSLEDINSTPVQANLQQLKQAHSRKMAKSRLPVCPLASRTSLVQPDGQQ